MNISIIGTGYVGLVTGACFAKLGHSVICVDIDEDRINNINKGIAPIYEDKLDDILKECIKEGRLKATTDIRDAVKNTYVSFICVGTPSGLLGYIDLKYIDEVSKDVGNVLKDKNDYHVVVVKSTVVPGTTEHSVLPLLEKNSGKKAGKDFGVCMNPEFLREGTAVDDFMYPDRIIIGGIDERSTNAILDLYKGLVRLKTKDGTSDKADLPSSFKCPIIKTDPKTAEMIKYATNSFLVTKISFINEIGNICKQLGIDVFEVSKGLGTDSRISPKFLNAGIGFGGSCFPKDVKALVGKAKEVYYRPIVLNAALELNETQPLKLVELLERKTGSIKNENVVVLGLAFKPGTDDMREAPSIKVVQTLIKKGANVFVTDPKSIEEAKKILGDHEKVTYCNSAEDAVKNGKYILIVTEWDEFKDKELYKGKTVIDGRKIEEAKAADYYEGVCW